jgi:Splicing factor 3B subunit 10 (SF3b10)
MSSKSNHHLQKNEVRQDRVKRKHVSGAGNDKTSALEWATNHERDTCAMYLSQPSMLWYMATAENKSVERTRLDLLQRMIAPCSAAEPLPCDVAAEDDQQPKKEDLEPVSDDGDE